MQGRIVVVGGLNMDLHLFGVHPSAGQAPLLADSSLAQPGGKGANVARAAARLGAQVVLVGRVGDDEFGRDCLAGVNADGVDTSSVAITPGTTTGFVAIELREGRHRSLVYTAGANDLLTWSDIEPSVRDLTSADIVVVQAEIPVAALDALATFTTQRRIPMFLDPTPPDRLRTEHLRAAEVITPDLAEAAQLVGRQDTSLLWPSLAAGELLDAGARLVLIKTGASGALLAKSDGLVQVPTLRVDAVDETGAGDVFLAALAVSRIEGADWEVATRFANAASALSVAASGLVLPTRRDVDEATSMIAVRTEES